MQDTSAGFDLRVEPHLPLEQKVLILYLFGVLLFALIRVPRLIWYLYQTRKILKSPLELDLSTHAKAKFQRDRELNVIKIATLKKAAIVSFFLSLLAPAYTAIDELRELSIERQIGLDALGGEGAELLTSFALGIAVCAILYAAYGFLDGAIVRQKVVWEYLRRDREGTANN